MYMKAIVPQAHPLEVLAYEHNAVLWIRAFSLPAELADVVDQYLVCDVTDVALIWPTTVPCWFEDETPEVRDFSLNRERVFATALLYGPRRPKALQEATGDAKLPPFYLHRF